MAEAMNTVQVLYATDRAVVGTGVPLQFANGLKADADTITYGVCQVALQSESDMNTDTASNVTEVQQESDKSWATRIEGQQVLALVHGYNNSFTDAVQGAARVKAVMPWNGPIVAFSWPSYGDGTKYLADEATYQRSLPAFSETLDVLQKASKVHIISHSMGNRVTSEALMHPNSPLAPNLRIGQLIFAAADVDAEVFARRLKDLSAIGEGRTMYMSSMDLALETSAAVHGNNPRAGQVWPRVLALVQDYTLRRPFVVVPGTDSIDCSGLDVGIAVTYFDYDVHAYYAQHPAIDDIRKVLSGEYPAEQRLSPNGQDGLTAVQAQPNALLGAIEQLTGQPPPVPKKNARWYRLDPPAHAPELPQPAVEAA